MAEERTKELNKLKMKTGLTKMSFALNRQKVLKGLFVFLFVSLLSYFGWDMSARVRGLLVTRGYTVAINELITAAENPQCQSFPVTAGERRVEVINIRCLEQFQDQPEVQE